jgi:hypothetical protein
MDVSEKLERTCTEMRDVTTQRGPATFCFTDVRSSMSLWAQGGLRDADNPCFSPVVPTQSIRSVSTVCRSTVCAFCTDISEMLQHVYQRASFAFNSTPPKQKQSHRSRRAYFCCFYFLYLAGFTRMIGYKIPVYD